MPELPEVQTVVTDLLESGLLGLRIQSVRVYWDRIVAAPTDVSLFKRQLKGRVIAAATRRGKYIQLALDSGDVLFIHLRMTGKLRWAQKNVVRDIHEHVVLTFTDGRQLRYHDTRKFGKWSLVDDPQKIIGHLGPEPLEKSFTWKVLQSRLRGKRPIKSALLDQSVVAGLGNIYVDEALWEAKINPLRQASLVSEAECKYLHPAIVKVLKRGLKNMGTSLGTSAANFYSVAGRAGRNRDELKVFRRTSLPCPRCGEKHIIKRIVVAQRSTHYCESCQK